MFRCLIINPPLANHSHGTGKQLQYFVQSSGMECHHLCWDAGKALGDEPCPFTNLFYDHVKRWPVKRGSGFVDRLQRRLGLGLTWQNGGKLSASSARKVMQLRSRHFDGAYVIVASERQAALARECLNLLGLPYIVNWMDLEERTELGVMTQPHISALCRNATAVFALTKEMARFVGRCAQRDIGIIRFGRPAAKALASSPAPGQSLRCVMIGSLLYQSVKKLWPDAFAQVRREGVEVDLYYIGRKPMLDLLPKDLPVTYLGSLSDSDRDAKLADMHVGLLPGPDGEPTTDYYARYSFPSRIADYFFHGLPVVGSIHHNSAAAEELKPLLGSAVWLSPSAATLAEAMVLLSKDRDLWRAASTAGAAYARANFDIKSIVENLAESLKSASGRENRKFQMSRVPIHPTGY